MQVPGRLTATAILQLISGIINLTVMWWLAGLMAGTGCGFVSGVISLGFCPIGAFCGFVPWILLPIGILEIVAGILGLASPKSGVGLLRVVAIVEMVSFLFGGLGSFVAGAVGVGLMNDPEVKLYLDHRG